LLTYIAMQPEGEPVRRRDIAAAEGLSEQYLVQLLGRLRSVGLVISRRGSRGGFLLGRNAGEITVADVVEAMEGPVSLVDCREEGCERMSACAVRPVWERANGAVVKVFSETTIASLAEQTKRLRRNGKENSNKRKAKSP
jgi:Rrf2 family protein